MFTQTLSPDIAILRDENDRSVLVCGARYTTAIDLPRSLQSLASVLETSRDLTDEGLRTVILTHEPEDLSGVLDRIAGVQVVRGDRTPGEDWEWDDVPAELLQLPEVPVHLVRHPQTVYDDTGRAFHIEPCLGSGKSLAVLIEPEDVLVCCDDLDPELPPRIHPGRVHETILRMEDWKLRAPRTLIPASGVPITGDCVAEMLDRNITYLRSLYQKTREGLMETRVPWERLQYSIPATSVWAVTTAAPKLVSDRHRDNVRYMAEDIFHRVQGEAEEASLVG